MSLREHLKIALIASFCVLLIMDVLDILSTVLGLGLGDTERNPLGIWFMAQFGELVGLVLLKVISVSIVGLVLYYVIDRTPRQVLDDEAALGGLVFVLAVGVLVLSSNFSIVGLL